MKYSDKFLATLLLALVFYTTPARAESGRTPILGWYAPLWDLTVPKTIASEGMNAVIVMGAQGCDEGDPDRSMTFFCSRNEAEKRDTTRFSRFLANARAAGVKVYPEIPSKRVLAGDIRRIVAFVRKYKNHPAIGGWYLIDEPEYKAALQQKPELVINAYRAIRAEDPKHPVLGGTSSKYASTRNEKFPDPNRDPILAGTDLPMLNYYPSNRIPHCPSNAEFGCEARFKNFNASFKLASSLYAERKKPAPIPILQGNGYIPVLDYGKKEPTYLEARYCVLTSLVWSPSSSLWWYMFNFSTREWRQKVLIPIVKEIKPLLPYSPNTTNGVLTSRNTDFSYRVFRGKNAHYLLVVNPNETTRSATFTLRSPTSVTCDGQAVPVSGKRFSLSLSKFTGKICAFR